MCYSHKYLQSVYKGSKIQEFYDNFSASFGGYTHIICIIVSRIPSSYLCSIWKHTYVNERTIILCLIKRFFLIIGYNHWSHHALSFTRRTLVISLVVYSNLFSIQNCNEYYSLCLISKFFLSKTLIRITFLY